MKKLIVLLCLILLSGCAAKTSVSDPSASIISGDGVSLSKQAFFEKLKNNDYTQIIVNNLFKDLATLENIDENTINEQAEASLEEVKEQYGSSYDMVASYYGGEDVLLESFKIDAIAGILADSYFDANKEELLEEYKPVKAKIIYLDTREKAEAMIEEIENGTSYEMAAAHQGYGSEVEEKVYTDKSDISLEVKSVLQSADEPMLSNVILSVVSATDSEGNTTSEDRYYVADITNVDPTTFMDEFYDSLASEIDTADILNYYMVKYDIEVYDQRTYELMSKTYEEFK